MDYSDSVTSLSLETIEKLKTAIEIGRWESGEALTPKQLESAMQAVMLWQAKHIGNAQAEPFVVGQNGELFTGKGESHKIAQPNLIDDDSIIVKTKV